MRDKTRIVVLLAAIAVVAAVALVLVTIFVPRGLFPEKEKGLPEGRSLLLKTRVQGLVQRGDAFPYTVEVWYDPADIAEIDKASLDKSVDFQPFEIRRVVESDAPLDSRTRVYRRQYELQLVEGQVGALYKFPSIVVRFKLRDSGGLSERSGVPDPVLVAARLPADVTGLALRPLRGRVATASQAHLPWILWGLAGVLAILGMVDLVGRAIPRWRARAEQKRQAEVGAFAAAYRSLCERAGQGTEPRCLFYQMEHILRVVLAHKGQTGWLDEPSLDAVPAEIRPAVVSLLERCQKGCAPEGAGQKDVEEATGLLEQILGFYCGEGVVETWRSSRRS